jgi:hypothetical protein
LGAREDILAAIDRLNRPTFTIMDVTREMSGSGYAESTIRTHITSRMCVNAPDHHAVTYPDLERVGRGVYRRRG